ncbi:MAG: YgiQ family radical SAM protein [Halodesulfovibrio sp.]
MKKTPAHIDQSAGRTPLPQPPFLPMSRKEMDALGWDELDVLIVSGDGYVDHPSFAAALLGRWLVDHGYRTGIVAQPRWDTTEDVARMGRPALFTAVSAGAIDSMLAHYTAFRKKRHDDAYTPGGKAGARPNRAAIAYTSLVRQAFPGMGVVIGGIEASLRRITHYDFWTDKLRRPILLDSKADCLVYGMGESALLEIAKAMDAHGGHSGIPLRELVIGIPGTAVMGRGPAESIAPEAGIPKPVTGLSSDMPEDAPAYLLPSHESMETQPELLMSATLTLERHVHQAHSWAVQPVAGRAVLIAPPATPLPEEDMDRLYALPFARKAHPSYMEAIPADSMICTSITTHRGCGGGCSFCSLALHQGRRIASRSRSSVMDEVRTMAEAKRFNGSISDVGGPSANMWQAECAADPAKCTRASCMHPKICPQFRVDQTETVNMLRRIRDEKGIKHVRVASGVRFDLAQQDDTALRAYTMEFTGGQLKVAPEHICDNVLDLMRKPGLPVFEAFLEAFERYSDKAGKEQYVIPYLMSGFPGCSDEDMRRLGDWLNRRGWKPQQVQCFIPTPGTVATAMFYAGIAPDGRAIVVARTDAERLRQHHILMPEMGRKGGDQSHGKNKGRRQDGGRQDKAGWPDRADLADRPGRTDRTGHPQKAEHNRSRDERGSSKGRTQDSGSRKESGKHYGSGKPQGRRGNR